jgi:Heterokaryon incompatibility protein (HET)
MASHGTPFPYPPLAADVDAIRVLTVAPAGFFDPLVCTLTPFAFSEKPKYVALSYTWGSSYTDNSKLPVSPDDLESLSDSPSASPNHLQSQSRSPPKGLGSGSTDQYLTNALPRQRTISSQAATSDLSVSLMLNGQPFHVEHNLHLALLHLRSPTHPIAVWADAICINQADTEERNRQVSIMSFIYTRATRVVAWLGTKNYYPSTAGLQIFRSMSLDWKVGQTQHFAAALAGEGKMRCSPKPTRGTIVRIAESTYWTRLWIVQEVCLPRILVLVYGSELWAYEDFRQWGFLPAVGQSLPQSVVDIFGATRRLLETREKKHTDIMTLESLIERFARSECSDLKDRVYGLLGCANDILPFVGRDVRADALKDYINSLGIGRKPLPPEPRRGIGSLRVDYSCSFYEIWTSVINFAFFQAKNVEGRVHVRAPSETQEQSGVGQVDQSMNEERRISIVRTAGIVQSALGQMIEEEFANLGHTVVSRVRLGRILRAGVIELTVPRTSRSFQYLGPWGM